MNISIWTRNIFRKIRKNTLLIYLLSFVYTFLVISESSMETIITREYWAKKIRCMSTTLFCLWLHADARWTYRIVSLPRFIEKRSAMLFWLQVRIARLDDFLPKSDHGLLQFQFALGQRTSLTLQNVISARCNERSQIRLCR